MGGSRYDQLKDMLKDAQEAGDEDKAEEIVRDINLEFPDTEDNKD
jgi:hypothetical protein